MIWDRMESAKKESAGIDYEVGWREDFSRTVVVKGNVLPRSWQIKGKPGTKVSNFSVEKGGENETGILTVTSNNSSGTLVTLADGLDVRTTPFLTWRWRADKLPKNADGREPSKDDQAIGIYVGGGSIFSNKSISYRWDTETPVGTEGNSVYGMGTVKVKWITLRNIEDTKKGTWFTEKRDFLGDYKKAWGKIPGKIYVSVSTNSQYTSSTALARLDWIEFISENKK
jgi:hypothetical protein